MKKPTITTALGAMLLGSAGLVYAVPITDPAQGAGRTADTFADLLQFHRLATAATGEFGGGTRYTSRAVSDLTLRTEAFLFQVPTSATVAGSPARCADNWRFFGDCAIGGPSPGRYVASGGLAPEADFMADRWLTLAAAIDQTTFVNQPDSSDGMWPQENDPALDRHGFETAWYANHGGTIFGITDTISCNTTDSAAARLLEEPATPEPATIALAGLGGVAVRRWRRG
jgi:hypothetical protein